MAKVEQKVGLNTTEYEKGAKRLSRTAKTETDRVGKEFDKAGDDIKDFSGRTKKNISAAEGSFKDLAKGFRGALGAISAAGVGLAIGASITKEVSESLDFETIINKAAAKAGLNKVQQAQFQNQLLDVSSRRNVEEEQVAAAADTAIALGATADEAVAFSDVIASTAKGFEGVDIPSLAEDIAKDIRARGGQVTAEAAQDSIEAIITGTRAGIGTFNDVLKGVLDLPGRVQERAGLTQRDLVELLGGAGGVAADPDIVNDAVRSLIKATDSIETRGAVQGVLGTQLRDTENNFSLTAKNLDEIAATLAGIGTEQQQRAVLTAVPGFDERSAEGLLALIRDRRGFEEARVRTEADIEPKREAIFEQATSGFLERTGALFNKTLNELIKKTTRDRPGTALITPLNVGDFKEVQESQKEIDLAFEKRTQQVSPLALPSRPGGALGKVLGLEPEPEPILEQNLKKILESFEKISIVEPGLEQFKPKKPLEVIFPKDETGVQSLRSQIKSPTTERQTAAPLAKAAPLQKVEVTTKIEIDSKDPGLTAAPKATEVQRQPGGL